LLSKPTYNHPSRTQVGIKEQNDYDMKNVERERQKWYDRDYS